MKGLFPHAGTFQLVELFGYTSHGLPGIEIIGMGKVSRLLKEKLIFLTRVQDLKLPMRRFVLCIEADLEKKNIKEEEIRYLEAPLLIMLWTLSGHLPMSHLDDCFSMGKINTEGEFHIFTPSIFTDEDLVKKLKLPDKFQLKVIAPEYEPVNENFYHLSFEGLIKSLLDRKSIE